MKQQQHIVKLSVPESELSVLLSWLPILDGATLVSTKMSDQEAAVNPSDRKKATRTKMKASKVAKVKETEDPRIVRMRSGRISIGKTLRNMGTSKWLICKSMTAGGTTEHKVKMAILRRRHVRHNAAYNRNGNQKLFAN